MLEGKVAFVTGGSGAVGAAIVRVMVREGARVAYSYHSHPDKAQQLDTELGQKVKSYPLDVLDAKAAGALAEQIQRELAPVDILVNNAGIAQVMPFALIEESDWDMVMDVNVKGMFLVTKAFVRGMIRRDQTSGSPRPLRYCQECGQRLYSVTCSGDRPLWYSCKCRSARVTNRGSKRECPPGTAGRVQALLHTFPCGNAG